MKKREFDINIYNLENKSYDYNYKLDDSFFGLFEDALISKGDLEVWVELVKTDTFIDLDFQIDGSIELECDRSLDKFRYPLHLREHLIYKFGEESAELSEEVYVIPSDAQQINLADPLFEFIRVSVPMKKLHPRYEQGFNEEEEQDEIIYTSKTEEVEEKKEIDPRWQALKDLKKKE